MGILDEAKQKAQVSQADAASRAVKRQYNDVEILVGETAAWLEQLLTEAKQAQEAGNLDDLTAIEDILRDVKVAIDSHTAPDGTPVPTPRRQRARDRAINRLNQPSPRHGKTGGIGAWFNETFVTPLRDEKKH